MATVGNTHCSRSPLPHVVAWCAPHHVPCVVENPSIFQRAKQELINRFISHFAPESVTMNLIGTDDLAAVKRVTERDGKWLVVGFQPLIHTIPRRAIASFQALKEMQECYEWAVDAKCPKIRIAWKNDMPAHKSTIYKTCKQIEISD